MNGSGINLSDTNIATLTNIIVAGRRLLATTEGLLFCEVLCVGKGFGFNHKIMINV